MKHLTDIVNLSGGTEPDKRVCGAWLTNVSGNG